MSPVQSQLKDYVTRTKGPSPLGTSLFVGLRLLGPVLACGILTQGSDFRAGSMFTYDSLNLSSLSSHQLIIFLMATGGSLKHIFWILGISEQQLPAGTAIFFGALETILDVINTWLFMFTSQPGTDLGLPRFVAGSSLFVLGLCTETVSEVQRRNFKSNPTNKGNPFSGGLFSLARNINYGGHVVWKAGYALASGGWVWAAVIGGSFLYDFATRGVPVLDAYCQNRV